MPANNTFGRPIFLSKTSKEAHALVRIPLQPTGAYDEAWLQHLIHEHPNLLPIEEVEPALIPAIPICTELSVPSGFIDNLYATPRGDLIVAETKLWRNPEARREVVGQILDYAKDLAAMTYEELNSSIRAARSRNGVPSGKASNLTDLVRSAGNPDLEEAQFVDSVSRNLRRGRFLLLIVGDGIREGVENIRAFLEQHAGLHFTLALVEVALYQMPMMADGLLVQPRVLMKTVNIERSVVSIEEGRVVVSSPKQSPAAPSIYPPKKTSMTAEAFFEDLAKLGPDVPGKLKKFLEKLQPLNVVPEFGTSSLILRWRPNEDIAWNLSSIVRDGKVWTEIIHAQADAVGLLALSQDYVTRLAEIVPGAYVKKTSSRSWHVDKDNTYIYVTDLLAHESAWFSVVSEFLEKTAKAIASST